MGKKVKGLVMEIKKDAVIIMTGDGDFIKAKKPSHSFSPGEEITSEMYKGRINIFKYTAIAAAILLILIPFTYLKQAYATVAYVNIDINPSLEMGINRYNKINSIIPLNDDAAILIESLSLKGLDIEEGLRRVISGAKDMGYIKDDAINNIEIALVKLSDKDLNISEDNLIKVAENAVENINAEATIEIQGANKEEHDNALKENMSTNKYLDKTENKNDNDNIKIDVKKPYKSKPDKSKDNNSAPGKNDKSDTPSDTPKDVPSDTKKDDSKAKDTSQKGYSGEKVSEEHENNSDKGN